MDCAKCGASVPETAEFCRTCGAPTRREARPDRPYEAPVDDLKARRRRVFIIGFAAVIGAMALGRAGSWADFDVDIDQGSGRPVVVEASELFEAYRDDREEADERFGDRGLVVTGDFVAINHDDGGNPDLRLKTSDPATPLGADLLSQSHAASARLRPGESVTVSCERVARTGDEHWLQNCSIEQVRPGAPAAPQPPAAPPVE